MSHKQAKRARKSSDYLTQVIDLAAQKSLPAGLHHVVVEHEDHCRYQYTGNCTCEPTVNMCAGQA